MAEDTSNVLVTSKPSDSQLSVSLHPLVLLTASDLLTRHRVRGETGPLAGVLLGRQTGQETTAEHAFPANLTKDTSGVWVMHEDWTQTRIQQFKDVHKAPALEAVGWFTVSPETGPLPEHVAIQKQFETLFNDNAILLTIHPAAINPSNTTNRKLPLTVYESVLEGEETSMQIDGEEHTSVKFRELPYAIETDETEMIAIDYVAKGAGSAAAVDGGGGGPSSSKADTKTDVAEKTKPDASGSEKQANGTVGQASVLTTEEEDQIAGMTTRLNSVKMLQSRLQILTQFIQSIPASYVSDQTIPLSSLSPDASHLPHLRNIQALLTRLSLLTPTTPSNAQGSSSTTENHLQEATRSQSNDVSIISMLSQLGQDVQGLSELGHKFAQVEQGKIARSKKSGGFGAVGHGSVDDGDGRLGRFAVRDNMLV